MENVDINLFLHFLLHIVDFTFGLAQINFHKYYMKLKFFPILPLFSIQILTENIFTYVASWSGITKLCSSCQFTNRLVKPNLSWALHNLASACHINMNSWSKSLKLSNRRSSICFHMPWWKINAGPW